MSVAEIKLWIRLRRLRSQGFHVRRQAPFRGYYLDFVCFGRRLVIEVDGVQHAEDAQIAHDHVRDAVLRREGFKVMRFWAGDVHRRLDWVMDAVVVALGEAAPPRSPRGESPSP